jgi:TonB family protein
LIIRRTLPVELVVVLLTLFGVGCKRASVPAKTYTESPRATDVQTASVRIGGYNMVHRTVPKYPEAARAAHVEGTVVVHTIIAKDGTVESAEVVSGPALLQGAAVGAVKEWVYRPYLVNGEPVRVDTKVMVNFKLNGAESDDEGAAKSKPSR